MALQRYTNWEDMGVPVMDETYQRRKVMSEHKGKCCGQCLWDGVPDKCCCRAIKGEK